MHFQLCNLQLNSIGFKMSNVQNSKILSIMRKTQRLDNTAKKNFLLKKPIKFIKAYLDIIVKYLYFNARLPEMFFFISSFLTFKA